MYDFPLPLQIIFYVGLLVALLPLAYRVLKGPHVLDRVMSLDALALIVILIMTVWNLSAGTEFFFDAVLALAIVGFISTVALARYLESGDIID